VGQRACPGRLQTAPKTLVPGRTHIVEDII
jgi:hypothetical protein